MVWLLSVLKLYFLPHLTQSTRAPVQLKLAWTGFEFPVAGVPAGSARAVVPAEQVRAALGWSAFLWWSAVAQQVRAGQPLVSRQRALAHRKLVWASRLPRIWQGESTA